MNSSNLLYVGVKSHVVALDKDTGTEVWRTDLSPGLMSSGHRFVTLLVDKDRIYAHTKGEAYCLGAADGRILWRNPLPGLSYDLATLARPGVGTDVTALKQQIDQLAQSSSQANTAPAVS